jgi:hypothetical protein
VHDKNKISYLLTPEFFGALRSAQGQGLFDDASVVEKIIALGQEEYTKMAGADGAFPEAELRDFIVAMNEVHKNNSNIAQSLEDAYIFLRINPSNSHDIIHYLLGFNRYSDILSEQRLKEFKDIVANNDQSVRISDLDYDHSDRERFIQKLLEIKLPSDQVKYADNNFPDAVAAIIQEKRDRALYSPKAIMGQVIYKNQPAFTACAEASIFDFLKNISFDSRLRIFNPSGFFPGLHVHPDVLKIFSKYNTGTDINAPTVNQDFIDIVSNVEGVTYVKNNYEISSVDNEKNLIALCNKFFSLQAKSLSDLREMLSNEIRSMNFELILGGDNAKKIAITIHDKKADTTKYMYLNFVPGHTEFEVGKENRDKIFLDPRILLANFNNPQSRALLYMHPQPVIDSLFFRTKKNADDVFDVSLYYAFPVNNDAEKSRLIRAILSYDKKNNQAVDYAYFLFDSLSDKSKILLKDIVLESDIFMRQLNKSFSANGEQTLKE